MTGQETIVRYLQDAEAAERNFEDALASISKMGEQEGVKLALARMSDIAKTQHERLEARLRALGAGRSTSKSALAHALGMAPTLVQTTQAAGEKNTQHLMITIAAAAAESAMYEALATAASAAGDQETVRLARELQREEHDDYRTAANLLRQSALASFRRTPEEIGNWMEDAIAAERLIQPLSGRTTLTRIPVLLFCPGALSAPRMPF